MREPRGGAAFGGAGARTALIVFAGRQRVGGLDDALERIGQEAVPVDVCVGGKSHNLSREEVVRALEEEIDQGLYQLVWIATPCSSFSVLHLDGKLPRLRSRMYPEGLLGLQGNQAAYLRRDNGLVEATARLARASVKAGATYVVENPVDRGMRSSPHFTWRTRGHAPLWLMPAMRELTREAK